jgi:hypothetical protein
MVHQPKEPMFLHLSGESLRDGWFSRLRGRSANSMAAP